MTDPPELELQMVVSHSVGGCKESSLDPLQEPPLQTLVGFLPAAISSDSFS